MIYGALALSQGLSPAAAPAMSSLLFAGSAQFLFCQLFGAGAPALVTVTEVGLLDLRLPCTAPRWLPTSPIYPGAGSWRWPTC